MAIRELQLIEDGPRRIVLVEVTYPDEEHTDWEFNCDGCGAHDTGLSEKDAANELHLHVCPETYRCAKCGRDVLRAKVGLGDSCPYCGQPTAKL